MKEEVWKDCLEFPDHYEVSDKGRVKGKYFDKVLAQSHHKTNCYRVRLCVNSDKYSRSVHRMVAEAFIDNPENKPEVNHIDGNRLNNLLENLEWVTQKENMDHAVKTGLINNPFGSKARHFKGVTKVWKDGVCVFELYGNRDITRAGFCYKLVSACILGKQKSHRGYTFTRGD